MAEPTPRPWRTEWHGQQLYVLGADGQEIAEFTYAIPTYAERYEEAKSECDTADAEHIVRCVNSFDDLVAALEAFVEWDDKGAPNIDALYEPMIFAREALVRAKSEQS